MATKAKPMKLPSGQVIWVRVDEGENEAPAAPAPAADDDDEIDPELAELLAELDDIAPGTNAAPPTPASDDVRRREIA